MRHCTNQQQHTTQYPPTPPEYKTAAFKHTINRTAWLPITHKAQHKECKTVAPLADNVYHLPKIMEKTTTQKENRSANTHDNKWAKFTCFKNHIRIHNKKNIQKPLSESSIHT